MNCASVILAGGRFDSGRSQQCRNSQTKQPATRFLEAPRGSRRRDENDPALMDRDTEMINILSMDGGPGPLMQLHILLEVERDLAVKRRSSFLEQVDLFAGTSDGALMALYLAQELSLAIEARERNEEPKTAVQIVEGCIRFSEEIAEACSAVRSLGAAMQFAGTLIELTMWAGKPKDQRAKFYATKMDELRKHGREMLRLPGNLWAMRRFLAGHQPFLDSDKLRAVLKKHFADRTLRSLRKNVVVVSFDTRAWSTRAFRNFAARDEHGKRDLERDLGQKLVDVAMCTASLPLLMPVIGGQDNRGYLDGIFSANNPAMTATSLAIRHLKVPMEQLRVLSLGVTQTAEEANIERRGGLLALLTLLAVDDRDARLAFIPMDWRELVRYLLSSDAREETQRRLKRSGIGPVSWGWLDYLWRPTLLANLFVHGTSIEEARQCQRILGDHFHRFTPRINLTRAMFRIMVQRLPVIATDLPWNAERCVYPYRYAAPLSTDEEANAVEYENFRKWLDAYWWPEQRPKMGRTHPSRREESPFQRTGEWRQSWGIPDTHLSG
ncbi:patatin-like phospholipase family protein [Sorangium sp. So ce134]